ncbi:uncharacterized protein A4U43_C05F22880 [Asparagus officinalis]|uniref:Uncharacterized protein n=1 Tax=Asparagus officinalis TaxID=4686 RepID=A0A5P1EW94_ASPOF|nr:uncharacterized protein A4U43_C05F22880 [Asparagus officinalis]
MVIKMVVRSLKKLRLLKVKKPAEYDKMDKTESMRVEIRSKKARKLIADTLKIADSPGRKSFDYSSGINSAEVYSKMDVN